MTTKKETTKKPTVKKAKAAEEKPKKAAIHEPKGEYLYADFGDVDSTATVTAPSGTATMTHNADLNANIFRVGVNRRF